MTRIHRVLHATTLKIAALLQESIVDWLDSVEETKASKWFYEAWTGEHASAEYVGTANANGTVLCWRYLKRDIIGHAGINVCMPPLAVFVPSVKAYETDFSIRHADGLRCEETG